MIFRKTCCCDVPNWYELPSEEHRFGYEKSFPLSKTFQTMHFCGTDILKTTSRNQQFSKIGFRAETVTSVSQIVDQRLLMYQRMMLAFLSQPLTAVDSLPPFASNALPLEEHAYLFAFCDAVIYSSPRPSLRCIEYIGGIPTAIFYTSIPITNQ